MSNATVTQTVVNAAKDFKTNHGGGVFLVMFSLAILIGTNVVFSFNREAFENCECFTDEFKKRKIFRESNLIWGSVSCWIASVYILFFAKGDPKTIMILSAIAGLLAVILFFIYKNAANNCGSTTTGGENELKCSEAVYSSQLVVSILSPENDDSDISYVTLGSVAIWGLVIGCFFMWKTKQNKKIGK